MTALRVLNQSRPCDGCALCCKLYDAKRADGTVKGAGQWCEHAQRCDAGMRCADYEARWECCREFVCLWAAGVVADELAPRRVRAVVTATPDGRGLVVTEDDRGAASRGTLGRYVVAWVDAGLKVFVVHGSDRRLIRKG